MDQTNYVCPCCGQTTENDYNNVTAIKSAKSWTIIKLTDDQISGLARGVLVLQTIPASGE